MLIEIAGLEARHGDVEVGLHDGRNVALVHAKVKRLDVVVVRQDPIDFRLDEDVGDNCRQVICRYLLVEVERVGLFNDFHHLLKLLKLPERGLLLLQSASFLDSHFPSMSHLVINFNSKCARRQLFKHRHLSLELFLGVAQLGIVEEF